MNIEKEFKSKVRAHLEDLTGDLVPVLSELVSYEYPKEVAALVFEVFYDSFSSGFPVRVFFVDDDNSEYFVYEGDEAKYPSPVDPGLLNIKQVYPKELEKQFSAQDEDLDAYTSASMELIDWFSRCWNEAGGNNCLRVAIIMIHDDTKVFDMKTNLWMED
jgi:hypothetical protein